MLLAPDTDSVALKTGEIVTLEVVSAPSPEWVNRIEGMLRHKGEPWNWQNSELLRRETNVQARFHVLHRVGCPFANVMVVESAGVGLLGHVWTEPIDRGSGASSLLLERALEGFRARRGQALFLVAEPDSVPWHYYRRRGFSPITPGSGDMELYRDSREAFEASWFAADVAVVEPLNWAHWPTAAPLCLLESDDRIRLAGAQLWGRGSSEGPLLPLIQRERARPAAAPPTSVVLRGENTRAVLAIAVRQPHPWWPGFHLLDLFSHPRWWNRSGELLAALGLNGQAPGRTLAYCDESQLEKRRALTAAGFRAVTTLPRWLKSPLARDAMAVEIFLHE